MHRFREQTKSTLYVYCVLPVPCWLIYKSSALLILTGRRGVVRAISSIIAKGYDDVFLISRPSYPLQKIVYWALSAHYTIIEREFLQLSAMFHYSL